MSLCQALRDDLPRLEDVGSGLENHENPGQSGYGFRPNVLEEGDAVQQILLERNGYQLFDLSGRQAECLCLDLDRSRGELGQDFDGSFAKLARPYDERSRRHRDDEKAELQTRSNDPTQHAGPP